MKKIAFLLLLCTNIVLNASQAIEKEIDTPLTSLTDRETAFVLQLVMINCVKRKDFVGLSHIIEKTKLRPGSCILPCFETGMVKGWQYCQAKEGKGAYCYRLYKAAIEARPLHKRTVGFLSHLKTLAQVALFADALHDSRVEGHLVDNPFYSEQHDAYELAVYESEKNEQINNGGTCISFQEWCANWERAWIEWHKEYLATH